MPGPIHRLLSEDHRRLEHLPARTTARPDTPNLEAYREFRAGLLRHIGMEEKPLIPSGALTKCQNGHELQSEHFAEQWQ